MKKQSFLNAPTLAELLKQTHTESPESNYKNFKPKMPSEISSAHQDTFDSQ